MRTTPSGLEAYREPLRQNIESLFSPESSEGVAPTFLDTRYTGDSERPYLESLPGVVSPIGAIVRVFPGDSVRRKADVAVGIVRDKENFKVVMERHLLPPGAGPHSHRRNCGRFVLDFDYGFLYRLVGSSEVLSQDVQTYRYVAEHIIKLLMYPRQTAEFERRAANTVRCAVGPDPDARGVLFVDPVLDWMARTARATRELNTSVGIY